MVLVRKDIFWQRILLTVCALAFAATIVSAASGTIMSDSARGFQLTGIPGSFNGAVSYVAPDGAAAQSGLHVGDVMLLTRVSTADRYRLETGVRAHERIDIPILRAGHERVIHYVSGPFPIRWDVRLFYGAVFWTILIAALLVWRRPESPEARVLCVLLLLLQVPGLFYSGSWTSPSALADFIVNILATILNTLASPFLATYALLFARPPSLLRRALTWCAFAAATSVTLVITQNVGGWMGVPVHVAGVLGSPVFGVAYNIVPYLFPLIALLLAVRAARNPERERLIWAALSMGPYYAWEVINGIVFLTAPQLEAGPAIRVVTMVNDVFAFLIPLGLAYSLLNRRLLDLGFAFNRAAIFTGVSIVIVGAFVLVEWAISDWMQRASHSTNIIISGALALVLGLSFRFVHARVEHVVDNVMFRKRRQDEEAIRTMAAEAPYITDRTTLLERMENTLTQHAGASFVSIMLHDGANRYGDVDENDPALVALRARHALLDLHTMKTAIAGEFAYPMVARGRLVGALVLGPKHSGESYAPDESAAIAALAHSVAGALDVLSTQAPSDTLEAIRTSLNAVSTAIAAQSELLRSITPQAGVQR